MNDVSRRNFLRTSVSVTAGTLLLPNQATSKEQTIYKGGLVTGQPKPLPYQSIPGFLSESQITPHYKAHYGGALRGYTDADMKLQSGIINGTTMESSAYGALQRARTNKANSVILHELYFEGMIGKSTKPNEAIRTAIIERFGSIQKWEIDFQASAKAASGWAILAFNPLSKKLYNVISDKHATGVFWTAIPLVIIDVYEHAFYVDYKNKKSLYIEKFMAHINWDEVSRRYKNIPI